jgi:hypothetical protein
MDLKSKIASSIELENDNSGKIGVTQEIIDTKAAEIESNLLSVIRSEIEKPEYSGMTPEEILNVLETPIEIVTESTEIVPAPKERVINKASDLFTLYIKYKGDSVANFQGAFDDEIAADPDGVGYEGKTVEEQIELMKTPIEKIKTEKNILGTKTSQLFMGQAYAPNTITLAEVTEALK